MKTTPKMFIFVKFLDFWLFIPTTQSRYRLNLQWQMLGLGQGNRTTPLDKTLHKIKAHNV